MKDRKTECIFNFMLHMAGSVATLFKCNILWDLTILCLAYGIMNMNGLTGDTHNCINDLFEVHTYVRT